MPMSVNVDRLKTIVKWVILTDVVAVVIGLITLPWRPQLIAAIDTVGIPQPTPLETGVLFICTIVMFYILLELAEADAEARP